MSDKNTPAFPVHGQPGMSLRDYFAAQAMTGLLAGYQGRAWDLRAQEAYAVADAMLKAREA